MNRMDAIITLSIRADGVSWDTRPLANLPPHRCHPHAGHQPSKGQSQPHVMHPLLNMPPHEMHHPTLNMPPPLNMPPHPVVVPGALKCLAFVAKSRVYCLHVKCTHGQCKNKESLLFRLLHHACLARKKFMSCREGKTGFSKRNHVLQILVYNNSNKYLTAFFSYGIIWQKQQTRKLKGTAMGHSSPGNTISLRGTQKECRT